LRLIPQPDALENPSASAIPDPPANIGFRGVIIHGRQTPTVWLDYVAPHPSERPGFNVRLIPGTVPNLEVTILKSGKTVALRPGQTLETMKGTVTEPYEPTKPVEQRTTP
jgi:hypothetical protein